MEINVLEDSKTKMMFELKGEGHAFCNALRSEILKNNKVISVGYSIEHPLINIPKFIIETKGTTPKDAILDAVKGLKKEASEFNKSFSKKAK